MSANAFYLEEIGHRAEDNFLEVCQLLGVKIVERPRDLSELPEVPLAIARGSEEDDADGVDFLFFAIRVGHWLRLDLTIASRLEVLSRKRSKAARNGNIMLRLPERTLELGARGCHTDLKKVKSALESLILSSLAA